jgi:hypothetical protein
MEGFRERSHHDLLWLNAERNLSGARGTAKLVSLSEKAAILRDPLPVQIITKNSKKVV